MMKNQKNLYDYIDDHDVLPVESTGSTCVMNSGVWCDVPEFISTDITASATTGTRNYTTEDASTKRKAKKPNKRHEVPVQVPQQQERVVSYDDKWTLAFIRFSLECKARAIDVCTLNKLDYTKAYHACNMLIERKELDQKPTIGELEIAMWQARKYCFICHSIDCKCPGAYKFKGEAEGADEQIRRIKALSQYES